MRPPVLPSGNDTARDATPGTVLAASMRPPVLPSGNPQETGPRTRGGNRMASMRPPVLPSGNKPPHGRKQIIACVLQ